jgi:periplasmic divalent cation tolerance protein
MARSLVEQRLAACVNILEVPVYSIYRWKGKIETAKETLLIIKSSRKRFGALQNAIKKLHSYDVPEIIALPIERGSRDYLAWLGESVSPSRISRRIHT